jgi:hypothetical protein
MAPYHHMMAHFPIALLGLAFLMILLRGVTASELGRRLDSDVMIPCLLLGVLGGFGALISGLLIWPAEGSLTSTMGRNKIIIASWMIAVWSIVLFLRWRGGDKIWDGPGRYGMLALGGFGAILLATTGTLGGHLLGSPSRFSGFLHQFGWSVYQTYFAPNWVLLVMVAVGIAGIAVGATAGRKTA